jgi:hypothetical protein
MEHHISQLMKATITGTIETNENHKLAECLLLFLSDVFVFPFLYFPSGPSWPVLG